MSDFSPFDFPLPYTSELHTFKLVPYRANTELKRRVDSLFRSKVNPYFQEFTEISTSGSRGLVNDMSVRAIACCRYYIAYPQQFSNNFENVELQILVRMWRQMFKHRALQGRDPVEKYMGVRMKLLKIAEPLFDELFRVVKHDDFIQHQDDMVKRRYFEDGTQVGLRDRRPSKVEYRKFKNIEYLCSLD